MEGVSLSTLSRECGLPVSTFRELNSNLALPTDDNEVLPHGLALSVPGRAAVPPLTTTVLTTYAEVLALAAAYQLDMTSLHAANNQVRS